MRGLGAVAMRHLTRGSGSAIVRFGEVVVSVLPVVSPLRREGQRPYIEKLIVDAGAFRAQRLFLLIASDTQVSAGVGRYASSNAVAIVRTRW